MEILSTKKVYDNPWLKVFTRKFKTSKGKKGEWIFTSRQDKPLEEGTNSSAVIVVPVWVGKSKDEIVLPNQYRIIVTKEFRVPIGQVEYGFPAGLIERGMTIADTAKKELKEETGLEIIRIVKTSPILCSSAGMTDEAFNYVYAYCVGIPNKSGLEDHEEIETDILRIEQLKHLMKGTQDKDGRYKFFSGKSWPIMDMFLKQGNFIL